MALTHLNKKKLGLILSPHFNMFWFAHPSKPNDITIWNDLIIETLCEERHHAASGIISHKDYGQTLITCINQISASIYQSALRGGADSILINPMTMHHFDILEYYMPLPFQATLSGMQARFKEKDNSKLITTEGHLVSKYTIYSGWEVPKNVVYVFKEAALDNHFEGNFFGMIRIMYCKYCGRPNKIFEPWK